ncbi:hypothetical protein HYW18_00115 [Candidatus Uhrbacteria bacterium]|nr:hypothetical protein [Candidatus Uhrbacteria bacterium]
MPYESISIVQTAFADLWASLLLFLPRFVGAVVVLIVGIFIAKLLQSLVVKVLDLLKIDELATKLEVKKFFAQAGMSLHVGRLLGWIVKWFFIVVFLVAAADILQWSEVTGFLRDVVVYLPNVLIAVVILLVGVLLATFVHRVVRTAVEAANITAAAFLAGLSKWAILIFSFMAALVQLGIAQDLIKVLFTGLVAMLALSGGLAFGLGGRDHATRFLNRLHRDISSDR